MIGHDEREDVGEAIRRASETVHAPAGLQAWLAAEQEQRGGRRRRIVRLRLAAAGALAAALAVAVVLTAGAGPAVTDVAAAGLQAPTQPAPAELPGDETHIDARIGRITFPYWEDRWGWRAVGARRDTVEGREALTVVYRKGRKGVHYTVVEGEALEVPEGARRETVDGIRAAVLRRGGADVVVWELQGQTCILASTLVDADEMLRFVAW